MRRPLDLVFRCICKDILTKVEKIIEGVIQIKSQVANLAKIKRFIWLFPLLYFIHDLEEILTVETFLYNHSETIPFTLTTKQFTFAFLLL